MISSARIRATRSLLGMSQAEVGEAAGVSCVRRGACDSEFKKTRSGRMRERRTSTSESHRFFTTGMMDFDAACANIRSETLSDI